MGHGQATVWLIAGIAIAVLLFQLRKSTRRQQPPLDAVERAWADAVDAPRGARYICQTPLGEFTPDECIKHHNAVVDAKGIVTHCEGCCCIYRRWAP